MPKRLTSFQKPQARREQERDQWILARSRFHDGLLSAGVSLHPLFVNLTAPNVSSGATWLTWWKRDEVTSQTCKVLNGFATNYITEVTLHGGRIAAPGEAHTARIWAMAEETGTATLDAAIILTCIRSLAWPLEIAQPSPFRKISDALFEWSWEALKADGIDPYSLSSVWFLPRQLRVKGQVDKMEDAIDLLSASMADFLLEWTPVRVEVEARSPSS